MLVKRGLEVADRYRAKTYVMSEAAALKLYLNVGSKLLETVSVNYSAYGGTEPSVYYFLVREPVATNPPNYNDDWHILLFTSLGLGLVRTRKNIHKKKKNN